MKLSHPIQFFCSNEPFAVFARDNSTFLQNEIFALLIHMLFRVVQYEYIKAQGDEARMGRIDVSFGWGYALAFVFYNWCLHFYLNVEVSSQQMWCRAIGRAIGDHN